MKQFCDFFFEFMYRNIYDCINEGSFTTDIRKDEVFQLYKKKDGKLKNQITDQLVSSVSKLY